LLLAIHQFISILQAEDQGIVKSFLRICTVLAIEQSFVPGLMATVPQLSYKSVDAFAKLIIMLYKISPEGPANANGTKANLLNKVFDTVVRVLLKNYDTRKTKFNQRPFFRLFASLLIDLNAVTPDTDPSHFAVLSAFK
jgi:CCR4-NOT transcription complex subunit 1